jgi:hypothetical protein
MPIVLYYDRFNLHQWNWQMDPYVNLAEFQRPAVKLPHHNGVYHGTVPLLNMQSISSKAITGADAGARTPKNRHAFTFLQLKIMKICEFKSCTILYVEAELSILYMN